MSFVPSEEEEKYFSARNAEARARIRESLEAAAQKASDARAIGATLGTDKDAVVGRIQDMGFDADKARVFDLLPLVHVAWADGAVQASERRVIVDILRTRGIEPDSEAWLLIEALLETRPSDTFLDETLALLKEVIGSSTERAHSIVELSQKVAEAHGFLFGLFGSVSEDERKLVEHIAATLGDSSAAVAAKLNG
jgi:tellurite resistance protein